MSEEIIELCWMIRKQSEPPMWWVFDDCGLHHWTEDRRRASKFATKEDADTKLRKLIRNVDTLHKNLVTAVVAGLPADAAELE